MGNLFRVILLLILTFIVIVFLLIFFLKPGANNEISGSSKSVNIVEKQNYFKGFGGGDSITTVSIEEQNIVEDSSAQQGFVPQENGT
jgi:hypothetical protein